MLNRIHASLTYSAHISVSSVFAYHLFGKSFSKAQNGLLICFSILPSSS